MAQKSRQDIRRAIHQRIRQKVGGTGERPRLAIFRSVNHIYAQVIDDSQGVTVAAAATTEKDWKGRTGGNIAAAAFQPGAASLGASGGVMGLAGAVVVGAVWSGEGLARSQWVVGAIIATVAFGFINPGISNAAHIGGLIAGGAVSLPLGLTARLRRTHRPASAPRAQATGTATGTATNPRQVEFQRRIDAAMAKARAEREEEARRAGSGE